MPPPRPDQPGPNQESVWDYPRPARAEATSRHLLVRLGDHTVAETRRGVRALETSHPPSYYFPADDVDPAALLPVAHKTWCEWKGQATYYDVVAGGRRAVRGAWAYKSPTQDFQIIAGHIAFDPRALACFVDGELARPQDGEFYSGWITSHVAGPFKGGPGTAGW